MKQLGVLLVVLSALVFAGCTTQPRVETDYQADFDFSSLRQNRTVKKVF